MRDDALPPQEIELIDLFIEHALFELSQDIEAFFRIGRAALLIVKLVENAVMVTGIIDRALVAADEPEQLEIRVVHEVALKVDADVKIALPEIIEIRSLFLLHVIDVEADLAPLIDDVDAGNLVRLFHISVL